MSLPQTNSFEISHGRTTPSWRDSTIEFRWTVPNFAAEVEKRKAQKDHGGLASDLFGAEFSGDTQWRLVLFPNGNDEKLSDFVSLYLHCEKLPPSVAELQDVLFAFGIVDLDSREETGITNAIAKFSEKDSCGYSDFLPHSALKRSLFKNEPLCISCKIIFYDVSFVASARVTAVPMRTFAQFKFGGIATETEVLRSLQKLQSASFDGFTDIEIVSNEKRVFEANRAIIAARSDKPAIVLASLRSEEASDSEEGATVIRVHLAASSAAVSSFLSFVYTAECDVDLLVAEDLVSLAKEYAMPPLVEFCAKELVKTISMSTFCELLRIAISLEINLLKRECKQFFGKNARNIVGSDQWKKFKSENSTSASVLTTINELVESTLQPTGSTALRTPPSVPARRFLPTVPLTKHTWIIDRFPQAMNVCEEDDYFDSVPFGEIFFLRCYPNQPFHNGASVYTAIYLHSLDNACRHDVDVDVVISVDGMFSEQRRGTFSSFAVNTGDAGWPKFCLNSTVEQLCKNGRLQIECEIAFSETEADQHSKEQKQLLAAMHSLREKPICSNFTIILADGSEFFVHREILVTRSDVFAAMMTADMVEKRGNGMHLKDDTSHEAMSALLDFIYTGTCFVSDEFLPELAYTARKYLFAELSDECERKCATMVSVRDFCEIYAAATSFGLSALQAKCAELFLANEVEILQLDDWQKLKEREGGKEIALRLFEKVAPFRRHE